MEVTSKEAEKMNDVTIEFIDAQGKRLKGDYQRLAQLRYLENKPKHERIPPYAIDILGAFLWDRTPEGDKFWRDVDKGLNPAIPYESLKELG